ncbi:hypothetical protein D3C71_1882600 [compost metagenome]
MRQLLHHLFRVAQKFCAHQAPRCQRPEHTEQQAVDVLVGHRGHHAQAGRVYCRTEHGFERMHLRIELRQVLHDALGRSCGA